MSVRKYRNGEIIFRESDISDSVYILIEGNVELTKAGEKGPIMLAMLHPGEMFGEMGILDQSIRSAAATAIGDVKVDETTRDEFMRSLREDPDMALKVMGKLVERLRRANDMLAHPTTIVEQQKKAPGQSMFSMLKKLVSGPGDNGAGRLEVRIAPLISDMTDVAEDQTRHVITSLGKRQGIRVKSLALPDLDPDLHPDDLAMKAVEGAQPALASTDSDLMIWGIIPSPGTTLHLHFVSRIPDDDDRPGYYLPSTTLTLPVHFGPELSELLLTVALSALVVGTEAKKVRQTQALSEALYAAMPAVQNLPNDLTLRERATVQMCYGNAVAAMAVQRGALDLYRVAEQTYRAALDIMSMEDSPQDWAIGYKHLGSVQQAIAERTEESGMLGAAVDSFGEALKVFTRTNGPVQWAAIQNRLGLVMYKLDLKTGDTETLKLSLNAFQAALQVFTRAEYPFRWAEVMNNFAQAATVLGEQLHSVEALEKAVHACRGALDVRKREAGPLLWAATQNNLGSALFLLGKMQDDKEVLNGAAEAFMKALDVYQKLGVTRLAGVAEKNLSKVKTYLDDLVEPHRSYEIPELQWESETEDEEDSDG